MFKIRALKDFSYNENGQDRGQGGKKLIFLKHIIYLVRDKAQVLCDLLADPEKLNEEREYARKNREKFMGIANSSAGSHGGSSTYNQSAAPASGKYGGYGSKDAEQYAYNNPSFGKVSGGYDPYINKTSTTTAPATSKTISKEEPEKKKKKKKKDDSSSEEEKDSSDESESSSEDEAPAKEKKKKAKTGLGAPTKSGRTINAASGTTSSTTV